MDYQSVITSFQKQIELRLALVTWVRRFAQLSRLDENLLRIRFVAAIKLDQHSRDLPRNLIDRLMDRCQRRVGMLAPGRSIKS